MNPRRKPADSSLELLLDTITNTFGGILFLAILVSLMLRSSGVPQDGDAQRGEPMSTAEQADLEVRLEDLRDMVERLQRTTKLAEPFAPPVPSGTGDDIPDLLGTLASKIDERARVTLATAELQRKTSEAEAEMNRIKEKTAAAMATQAAERESRARETVEMVEAATERHVTTAKRQQAAEAAAASLAGLRIDLDDAAEPAVIEQTAGLPELKETNKQQVALYVRFGRLFIMHAWRNGQRAGPNPAQFVVFPGNPPVARPKPETGVPINRRSVGTEIGKLRQTFPPARWCVAVVVFADSFAEFQLLKKAIVDAGYEYNPIPLEADGSVLDSGGASIAQ